MNHLYERSGNMSETEISVDVEELFEQAEALDEESRDAITAVLIEDLLDFYDDQDRPSPYLLQQIYDTISNEARIVREDSSEEFSLVEGFERESTISEDILRGELQFDEVLSIGSMEAVDVSELRLPWAGRNLRKRIAAACREEICEIEDVFNLDEDTLKGILPDIIAAVLVSIPTGGVVISGSALSGALLIPIAVLVALFVIQVGINVYCKEYDLGDANQ